MRSLLVLGLVVGAVGCTGFADEVRQERDKESTEEESLEAMSQLYESMVAVFREDTEGIDDASRETLTVVSDYESVPDDRRRRFVGRVVPAGGGIGVRITAEYQHDVSDPGEKPEWEDQPRELVEREASPDELKMARRIERRYHGGDS